MWVRRFRVISCRDAALASSKCAGWFSVKSVSSVFKKTEVAPPQPSPRGGRGWRDGEIVETSDVGVQVPCHQLPRRGIRVVEMCRMVFCELRVIRV